MLIFKIKKREEITRIRNHFEKNLSTKNFRLFISKTPEKYSTSNKKRAVDFVRFAVIVTKKLSKDAVIRNRVKRILREAFRIALKNVVLPSGYDYQIIAKREILESSFNEVLDLLQNKIISD